MITGTIALFSGLVTAGIIGVAVVFVLFYVMGVYNKLIKLKNMVSEAWSGIDIQLKKRHDLIPNLVETVKGYAKHEKETFEEVTRARSGARNADSVQDKQKAENQLSQALVNLYAVAEQYPELKANTLFLELQEELTNVEEDLERARRYYNGTARENNIAIEQFPSNLIAGAFNFEKSEYFEIVNPQEKQAPKVSF